MINKKGLTLIELLITITILGIILAIALPMITKISEKDIETQKRIYEEVMTTAGKVYNDSYQEDTFGRKKYGCAKIGYSKLKDKDLIKELESNKLNCAYQEEEKDTSGLIVRKIENKYYYETIIWCKNKTTGTEEQTSGNIDEKFYNIPEEYCSETELDDINPPTVYYTNNNKRYYYNATNLPKPKVWINDAVSGLKEGNQTINIEWKNIQDNSIMTDKSGTQTYTISKKGMNLLPQTIELIDEITSSNGNGQYQLTVSSINVEDGSGHVLDTDTKAIAKQPKENPSGVNKLVTHPDIFYVENSKPIITTTPSSTSWKKDIIPVSLSVTDNDGKEVYSGIKRFNYTVKNNSTNKTINTNTNCDETSNEDNITKEEPKNKNQESKNCALTIGENDYVDGEYTVTTSSEDWAGNASTTSNTYKYDGTSPVVTIKRKAYNQYEWSATDSGYSGLNGYVNNTSSEEPTSGWKKDTTGTVTISTTGTYYTHVRDKAGNKGQASITAYTVTRNQGAGTKLTTKYENSNGTAFTDNPIVLKGTPIHIVGRLTAGYGNLVIKFGKNEITNGTIKKANFNVTISTSATKCSKGYWNDGTYEQCQKCPTGYTSDEGATAQNKCYMNVDQDHYVKKSKDSNSTKCAAGYYKEAHKVYYGKTSKCKLYITINISNPTNGNWTNTSFPLTVSTNIDANKVAAWYYSYANINASIDNIGNDNQTQWKKYDNSKGKKEFITTEFTKERNQKAYIMVCSTSDECKKENTRIKIDKHAPEWSVENKDPDCPGDPVGKKTGHIDDPNLETGGNGSGYNPSMSSYTIGPKDGTTTHTFSGQTEERGFINAAEGLCSSTSEIWVKWKICDLARNCRTNQGTNY